MIVYDTKRSQQVIDSAQIVLQNTDVHERAMGFYKLLYKLTKSKFAERKFNEHKNAAICELAVSMPVLLNEIMYLEELLTNEEEVR